MHWERIFHPAGLLLQTSHTCHDHHLCAQAHQGLECLQKAFAPVSLRNLRCLAPLHSEILLELTSPVWHFIRIMHWAYLWPNRPVALALHWQQQEWFSTEVNGHSTPLTITSGTSFTKTARQATCPLQEGTSWVLVSGAEESTAASSRKNIAYHPFRSSVECSNSASPSPPHSKEKCGCLLFLSTPQTSVEPGHWGPFISFALRSCSAIPSWAFPIHHYWDFISGPCWAHPPLAFESEGFFPFLKGLVTFTAWYWNPWTEPSHSSAKLDWFQLPRSRKLVMLQLSVFLFKPSHLLKTLSSVAEELHGFWNRRWQLPKVICKAIQSKRGLHNVSNQQAEL